MRTTSAIRGVFDLHVVQRARSLCPTRREVPFIFFTGLTAPVGAMLGAVAKPAAP